MADIGYCGCDLSDFRRVGTLTDADLKSCRNRLPAAELSWMLFPRLSFCAPEKLKPRNSVSHSKGA